MFFLLSVLTPEARYMDKFATPLVSVICLCYNQARFVAEALASVLAQTYSSIELIIVDDASTDQSVTVIQHFLRSHPTNDSIKTLFLPRNLGNCAAFNQGMALARGKYMIDFATDDVMLPQRIEQQVAYFETLPNDYGVVFTEAQYIDEQGSHLYYHYQDKLKHLYPPPTGDVYAQLLSTYFVAGPSMMVKKEVLDTMHGYDEQLAYEDFDFWVRSSRDYRYAYLDECTTQIRKHPASMSTGWYRPGDPQLHSTYLVCLKAKDLNRTEEERKALVKRVKYEIRQAVFADDHQQVRLFFGILMPVGKGSLFYRVLLLLLSVNTSFLKKIRQFLNHIRKNLGTLYNA